MTPNYDPKEDPADRTTRIRRQAYGESFAEAYVLANLRKVIELIAEEDDDRARDMFDVARLDFAGGQWEPKVGQVTEATVADTHDTNQGETE